MLECDNYPLLIDEERKLYFSRKKRKTSTLKLGFHFNDTIQDWKKPPAESA